MDRISFSVVIPLFNKERFVRKAIETALGQTHPPQEIIVVDDGSSDGSVAALDDLFGSGAVRLIEQANAGPGPARNRGIDEASSLWVALLDADDLWLPDHLETLADLVARFPDAGAVTSGFCRIAADAAEAPRRAGDEPKAAFLLDYFSEAAMREAVWTSATAVRRDVAKQLGGFGSFFPGEDVDFWVRLALDHPIAATRRVTAAYRVATGGLMDSWHGRGAQDYAMQPVFVALDRALGDPGRGALHASIRRYRGELLNQHLRQALYRGDPGEARAVLGEIRRSGGVAPGLLAMLASMPRPVMRAASRSYSAAKRILRAG